MEFKGIILAAGLSSRMGSFKPLLPFNGSTVIENTVSSLIRAGIEAICVVTGKNAMEVENILKPYQVKTIRNLKYESSDMLSSIKLGLKETAGADGVFVLPGDIPYVRPETVRQLKEEFIKNNYDVLYPCCQGKKGHPPLIGKACFEDILTYEGEGGLKDILSKYQVSSGYLETPDCGTLLDIDYKEDYEALLKLQKY